MKQDEIEGVTVWHCQADACGGIIEIKDAEGAGPLAPDAHPAGESPAPSPPRTGPDLWHIYRDRAAKAEPPASDTAAWAAFKVFVAKTTGLPTKSKADIAAMSVADLAKVEKAMKIDADIPF